MAARASRLGLWLAAALLPTGGMPSASADAGDGFYAGLALERSVAGVDYEKSVEFASPLSAMTAWDRARDAVDALTRPWGIAGRCSADGIWPARSRARSMSTAKPADFWRVRGRAARMCGPERGVSNGIARWV